MKRFRLRLFICFVVATGSLLSYPFETTEIINAKIETQNSSYYEWGKLAVKEGKKKYPKAKVIDYSHKGKQQKDGLTAEKFKLWLKQDNKDFGVFVNIEYNTKTEEVIDITFKETSK